MPTANATAITAQRKTKEHHQKKSKQEAKRGELSPRARKKHRTRPLPGLSPAGTQVVYYGAAASCLGALASMGRYHAEIRERILHEGVLQMCFHLLHVREANDSRRGLFFRRSQLTKPATHQAGQRRRGSVAAVIRYLRGAIPP